MNLSEIGHPIVKAIIADTYAVPFEYAAVSADRPNDLSTYYTHPRHGTGNGRYSDDGESSTAVGEAMLEGPLTRESLAKWFVRAFHREQRRGYAGGYFDFLMKTKTGEDFLANIRPNSDKSGAAMRGWLCGHYKEPKMVLAMAELQAKLTHDTPGGIMSAKAAALMTHYFAYDKGPRTDLAKFLCDSIGGPWFLPWSKPVGSKGMESVHAAVQAIMMHDRMSMVLKQCVDFTGDTDTVATIALGSSAFARDIEQDLPQHLFDNLEDGQWGKPYLLDLDDRLAKWRASQ
jgi:ADP-ribosyl-[dinitrogen reductase] hydrolase